MANVSTEALTSSDVYCDDDKKDLEQLLDAFGSAVSLKDIASAYCQAGRNVYTAGELLCNLQGSTSSGSTFASKDESQGLGVSRELSDDNLLDESNFAERNSISMKQKRRPASVGTVSGVIGRGYARPRPSRIESGKLDKPLTLNSEELPISEIWDEKAPTNMTATAEIHKDTEEFLFTMLGDGFQLDRKIIQEVLGRCGYDIQRSMEKLLDLSASTLEKSDDVKRMEKYSDTESLSCQEQRHCINSARSGKTRSMSRNASLMSDDDRYNLQKEVLEALFSVPERFEEAPEKTCPVKAVGRSRGFGRVVFEPLRDTSPERTTAVETILVSEDEDEEDEGSYQVLRKSVREYWITMKEYYEAAVEAFANGDHRRAYKLLEEGHFFKNKAREADEKSAEKFLESREEDVPLDLHEHDPKDAIHLLRLHLSSLSGIPSIQYLKVIVGAKAEDTKEGARKRLIMKLLEKESIKWSEEMNGRIIMIRLDEIDPKRLSFAKKAA